MNHPAPINVEYYQLDFIQKNQQNAFRILPLYQDTLLACLTSTLHDKFAGDMLHENNNLIYGNILPFVEIISCAEFPTPNINSIGLCRQGQYQRILPNLICIDLRRFPILKEFQANLHHKFQQKAQFRKS